MSPVTHEVLAAAILDWVVVVAGLAVVLGAVAAVFVLVPRLLRRPEPSRPRTRRPSGQLDPPAGDDT